MSFTYRKAIEADREKYLDFANLVFSNAHCPHDFQALIPKVYGEGRQTAHMQNIAVRDDGAIRGLVAVMPNELNVMGVTIKTGYVGTVSVHPYARGEGHMKKLMTMAIEGMQAEGVDMAMLGGQRQRYEYFGFCSGGISRNHRITPTNVRHVLGNIDVSNIEINDVAAADSELLEKCACLNESRKVYASRPAEEFHIISQTWNNVLKAVVKDGEFAGYIIVNGGGIAELMLKDWNDTLSVLKKYIGIVDKAVSISTGEYETDLNRELAKIEEGMELSHAEMIRVFNFPKVIGALMHLKASYTSLENATRSFIIDGKPMTISVHEGEVTIIEEAEGEAMELTAMEAQRLFLGFDGELLVGRLPMGWANLPHFMSHIDAF